MKCDGCERDTSPLKQSTMKVERNGKTLNKVAWLCKSCREDGVPVVVTPDDLTPHVATIEDAS